MTCFREKFTLPTQLVLPVVWYGGGSVGPDCRTWTVCKRSGSCKLRQTVQLPIANGTCEHVRISIKDRTQTKREAYA